MSDGDPPILSYARPPRSRGQHVALIIALGFAAIAASVIGAMLIEAIVPNRFTAMAFVQIDPPLGTPMTDSIGASVEAQALRLPSRQNGMSIYHIAGTQLLRVQMTAATSTKAQRSVVAVTDEIIGMQTSEPGVRLSVAQSAVAPTRPQSRRNIRNAGFAVCMLVSCVIVPLIIRRRVLRLSR